MSGVTKLRTSMEIDEEAAAWVWRLDGGLSPAEQREFEAWLRRDSRHRRAFEELGGVWSALDGLADAKRDEKLATFAQPAPVPTTPRPRRWWPLAAAAALLAVVGAQMWLHLHSESQTVATAVGQQREVNLADGSVISLNTNSIVETNFTRAAREVRLLKGEAHFSVAKDANRPFRVHAGETMVRAVGTQFAIRMVDADDVEVIVSEGRVEVTALPALVMEGGSASSSEGQVARIRPGQIQLAERGAGQASSVSNAALDSVTRSAIVRAASASQRVVVDGAAISVATLDAATLSRQLAWREGAVVLDGEPLSQAVDMLNRYTELRLLVSDPTVAQMRVGGRFKANDVDGFLHALEAALPVSVRKTDNGLVYIEPRR